MNSADWTPVLKGETYCSPRCGGGCKRADHNDAQDKAAALAHQLGEGWEPRVWENLGWHWEATKGECCIGPSSTAGRGNAEPRFRLMWNLPVLERANGVTVVPQIILSGSDPADLLGLAKQDARTWLARIEHALSEVE